MLSAFTFPLIVETALYSVIVLKGIIDHLSILVASQRVSSKFAFSLVLVVIVKESRGNDNLVL